MCTYIVGVLMRIEEGQFGGSGDKPKGLLGAVQRHWDIVCGRARGMGVTEQWAARALVRGLLDTAGGTEEDGRMVLVSKDSTELEGRVSLIGQSLDDLRASSVERTEALAQDFGGLKMILVEIRALVVTQEVMLQSMIETASADGEKIAKLEKLVSDLEAARVADAKKLEDFVSLQSTRIDRPTAELPPMGPAQAPAPTQNRKRSTQPQTPVVPPADSAPIDPDKW